MLVDWAALSAFARAALAGMADPVVIALVLAATTLLVEDVAIAAGAALATQGVISWELAFVAVAGGIALGDIGLYAMGAGARSVPWLRRRYIGERSLSLRDTLQRRMGSAVLLARVIPGLRLLTYTASGFLRVSLAAFCLWVVLAVTLWTVGLFVIASLIGDALVRWTGLPAPVAVALPIVVLALAIPVVRRLRARRRDAA